MPPPRRIREIPAETILVTVARIQLALGHGNYEEAHTALLAAFALDEPPTCAPESHIFALGLSIRTEGLLTAAGIQTVGQLCRRSRADLLKIRHVGEAIANEIEKALKRRWLRLTPSVGEDA